MTSGGGARVPARPRSGLSLLAGSLTACSPASVPSPAPPPVVHQYRMDARFEVSQDPQPGGPIPLPFAEGTSLLGLGCEAGMRLTGGLPPPCVAERWTSEEGESRVFLRVGDRAILRDLHVDRAVKTNWETLDGPLGGCLGDPLSVPPAGDPDGFRLLQEVEGTYAWILSLSGQNLCGLGGQLIVHATRDHAEVRELTVQGGPWDEEGRQKARASLFAFIRQTAVERWSTLDEAARLRILTNLADDPEPAAVDVLQDIARSDPQARDPVRRALERRALRVTRP